MVISDKQQEANRQNAQHSTGPNTPEAKAAVRLNALTYGLRARDLILPNEDSEEYKALGRSRSRVATPEPHRADASGTDVHLPMVARAVCQKREAHLCVRNLSRETVSPLGSRFHPNARAWSVPSPPPCGN